MRRMQKTNNTSMRATSPTPKSSPKTKEEDDLAPNVMDRMNISNVYVMPFDVNAQYFVHIIAGMTLENAMSAAYCKYSIIANAKGDDLREALNDYISSDEIKSFATEKVTKVNKLHVYAGVVNSSAFPSLFKYVKTYNFVIPEEFGYEEVMKCFVPQYVMGSGNTLGNLGEYIVEAFPILALNYATYDKFYSGRNKAPMVRLENVFNIKLDDDERRILINTVCIGITGMFRKNIVDKYMKVDRFFEDFFLRDLSDKVFLDYSKTPREAVMVFNILLDVVRHNSVNTLIPESITRGMAQMMNGYFSFDLRPISDESTTVEIRHCYMAAKAILSEFGGKKEIALEKDFVSSVDMFRLFKLVICPILNDVHFKLRTHHIMEKK
jgi:hypothetical protein